ncbi:MAG: hypothetical protein KDN19_09560 [Verrucomicrobiae bacterium]|nr:hypothetical protein [Verrucomicrobiae bacterium]
MTTFRDTPNSRLGAVVFIGLVTTTLIIIFASRETSRQQAETEEEVSNQITALKEALNEARNTRDALQHDLDKMTRERVELDGELTRQQLEGEQKVEELSKLQEELKEIENAGQRAAAQVGELKSEIESVRANAKSELEAERAEANQFKKKAEAEALQWAQTKGNLAQQLNLAQQRLEAFRDTDDQKEIAHLKKRITDLEQKLDTIGNQRNELARSLRSIREASRKPAVSEEAKPKPEPN